MIKKILNWVLTLAILYAVWFTFGWVSLLIVPCRLWLQYGLLTDVDFMNNFYDKVEELNGKRFKVKEIK